MSSIVPKAASKYHLSSHGSEGQEGTLGQFSWGVSSWTSALTAWAHLMPSLLCPSSSLPSLCSLMETWRGLQQSGGEGLSMSTAPLSWQPVWTQLCLLHQEFFFPRSHYPAGATSFLHQGHRPHPSPISGPGSRAGTPPRLHLK